MKVALKGTYNEVFDWLYVNLPLLKRKPKCPKVGDRWGVPLPKNRLLDWAEQIEMLDKSGKREFMYNECVHNGLWHIKKINVAVTDYKQQ